MANGVPMLDFGLWNPRAGMLTPELNVPTCAVMTHHGIFVSGLAHVERLLRQSGCRFSQSAEWHTACVECLFD